MKQEWLFPLSRALSPRNSPGRTTLVDVFPAILAIFENFYFPIPDAINPEGFLSFFKDRLAFFIGIGDLFFIKVLEISFVEVCKIFMKTRKTLFTEDVPLVLSYIFIQNFLINADVKIRFLPVHKSAN